MKGTSFIKELIHFIPVLLNLLVQSRQWKLFKMVWNMFKVNSKTTSFLSRVSIVDFEKVNASWMVSVCTPWKQEIVDDFRGSRSLFLCLDSLNIRSKTWRQSLEKQIVFGNLLAKLLKICRICVGRSWKWDKLYEIISK